MLVYGLYGTSLFDRITSFLTKSPPPLPPRLYHFSGTVLFALLFTGREAPNNIAATGLISITDRGEAGNPVGGLAAKATAHVKVYGAEWPMVLIVSIANVSDDGRLMEVVDGKLQVVMLPADVAANLTVFAYDSQLDAAKLVLDASRECPGLPRPPPPGTPAPPFQLHDYLCHQHVYTDRTLSSTTNSATGRQRVGRSGGDREGAGPLRWPLGVRPRCGGLHVPRARADATLQHRGTCVGQPTCPPHRQPQPRRNSHQPSFNTQYGRYIQMDKLEYLFRTSSRVWDRFKEVEALKSSYTHKRWGTPWQWSGDMHVHTTGADQASRRVCARACPFHL
jgi:hypothetical protein